MSALDRFRAVFRLPKLEKRVSLLEEWKRQHTAELGDGGAPQRIAEFLELSKAVRNMAEKLQGYEGAVVQAIEVSNKAVQTSNTNLNVFLTELTKIEKAIRTELAPIVKILARYDTRIQNLEIQTRRDE